MDNIGDRFRFFQLALGCSAFLFIIWLAGMSLPALAASPITGVTVAPATVSVSSGGAVYLRAVIQGTGDFDHRVNWSLSPGDAGSVSPTGLFISGPTFTGTATVTATSVENPNYNGTATITVNAGGGVVCVDRNNLAPGAEDGSATHPYRTIQGAIGHAANGDTIKVAQGTYSENAVLDWQVGVLLLGGFKGGSASNYANGQPGDFVTRSTDHINQVTTIQSPARQNPVVNLENWSPPITLSYAVDGFILTGGSNGIKAAGRGPITLFISQNLIIDNGTQVAGPDAAGGGVNASGINALVLNNRIANNQSGFAGGLRVETDYNTFLIQGNIIENNEAGGDIGGGVILGQFNQGQGPGLFTWNIVRNNRANLLLNYGTGGGLAIGGGPIELSHNTYAGNQSDEVGGGIIISDSAIAVLRHELIYKNTSLTTYGGGIYVQRYATATLEHCTITGNTGSAPDGNGLMVREKATVQVENSIIWGNSGDQIYLYADAVLAMTYSDSQPFSGVGNLSIDPQFANPTSDDYHLKSVRGRWDSALAHWVTDTVHSPCIDKGDPLAAFDQEPSPNHSRTNMGVYGNTPEASKSRASLEGTRSLLLEN